VHYLLRAREMTGMRLLTIHNLAYVQRLMAALREAVQNGELAATAAALRAGAAPWQVAAPA
jgi:queuine tRNA-ribosyltransferase